MTSVLFLSPEQFRCKPQVGTPREMTWDAIAHFLSEASIGETKDIAGGYSPASYTDNVRRKSNLITAWLLVVDVDGNGDVDRIADAVAKYDAIVHETFSSTNDDPRCRVLLRLAVPVDAATYEATHAIVRARLRALAAVTDDGAKDASRLSYCPVRRPGASYRFRLCEGRSLDAARVLAAQPPKPPPPIPQPIAPQHMDAYKRGALQRAAQAIMSASEGARHETLNKEAYALARLGLTEREISAALLPSAVAAMGERRKWEAQRTIRDAVLARRGAA